MASWDAPDLRDSIGESTYMKAFQEHGWVLKRKHSTR